MRNGAERKQQDSGTTIMLIFFIGLLLSGATLRAASSVTVQIDSAYPDPACIGDTVDAMATAVFDAEGREQEQASLGWIPEYRWKWEMLSDGEVTSTTPTLDPENPQWTLWSDTNQSTMDGDFPSAGEKIVKITVDVRLHKTGEPTSDIFTDAASEALTVINLANVPRVFLVSENIGEVTLAWVPSPSPNVAGYKYHIAPGSDTMYDVGNVTEARITGLTPGQHYKIYIHTYDTSGNMTHSPSWEGVAPIDTDGDGEFDETEDFIGTDKYDFGDQPAPVAFDLHMTSGVNSPEVRSTCLRVMNDFPLVYEELHIGEIPPLIPEDFVCPWSECPVGQGDAHELYSGYACGASTTCLVLDRGTPGPEMTLNVTFPEPVINELSCLPAEYDFRFLADQTRSSRRMALIALFGKPLLHQLTLSGPSWDFSASMGYNSVAYPSDASWSYFLSLFLLSPLQADLDYTVSDDVPQSGRPDFQVAPLQMAARDGQVTVTLEGRTPLGVIQTVTLNSSNTGVLKFKAGSASSGGTVNTDGSQTQWIVEWTSPPPNLTVDIEEGDNPGGQSASFTGTVADINSDAPQDGLKVRLFPEGTHDTDGNEVPAFFVAQTGSSETTALLNIDLDIDSDNNGTLDNSAAEDQIEDTASTPGKLIPVNDGDADGDGTLNCNDYDGDEGNAPQFAPLSFQFCAEIDPDVARVTFSYPEIAPGATPSTSGPEMRIWTKDGNVSRNTADLSAGGDFVGSGNTCYLTDLPLDPDTPDTPTRRLLFVEGVSPSATVADARIEVLVDPDGPDIAFGFDLNDAVRLTITKVDLDIFDYDSDGNQVEVPDEDEEVVGSMALLNDDDDDGDGVNDDDSSETTISGEDDLQKVVIRSIEPPSYTGSVILTFPSSVGMFENADKSGEVSSGSTFPQSSLPKTLWVEGRTVSESVNDVEITAGLTGDASAGDTVKLTVAGISLVHMTADGSTMAADAVNDVCVPFVSSELLNEISENENGPFPAGDGGGIGEVVGEWENLQRTDLTDFQVQLEISDPRVTGDTVNAVVEIPGGDPLTVTLDRVEGNLFRTTASDSLIFVFSSGDFEMPNSIAALTAVGGSNDPEITVRIEVGSKLSPRKRRAKRGIEYYKAKRTTVSLDGEDYVVNPCKVVAGEKAVFMVNHAGIDTSRIEWRFKSTPPDGTHFEGTDPDVCHGERAVISAGTATGALDLAVTVTDYLRQPYGTTSVNTEVVTWESRLVYLASVQNGTTWAVSPADALQQIETANMIWRQAGIRFIVADRDESDDASVGDVLPLPSEFWCVVVSDNWYDDLLDDPRWDPNDTSEADGFEVYFVNSFEWMVPSSGESRFDVAGICAASWEGMIVTPIGVNGAGNGRTVAHELGHAMGLWWNSNGAYHPSNKYNIGCPRGGSPDDIAVPDRADVLKEHGNTARNGRTQSE